MKGAQQEDFKFFQTLNGTVICNNTISNVYIRKVIHIRDKAEIYVNIRGAVAHMWWKNVSDSDSAVEKDKESFYCQGYRGK